MLLTGCFDYNEIKDSLETTKKELALTKKELTLAKKASSDLATELIELKRKSEFKSADMLIECNSITGRGDVSCDFTNTGKSEGGVCALPVISGTVTLYFANQSAWGGNSKVSSDSKVCSGLVRANDVKTVKKTISFSGLAPAELCALAVGDVSWTKFCSISAELI